MNLHEYQAKELFSKYGLPIPRGITVTKTSEASAALDTLSVDKVVVKAQIHAGGRGKAGGVKLTTGKEELEAAVKEMLGTNLVTYQTDSTGQPVNRVLIEKLSSIKSELYLGAVLDRASQRVVIMASTEGGVDIEKVAEETPQKILQVKIDPTLGFMPYQGRQLAFGLGLDQTQMKQFVKLATGLVELFCDFDLSLVEINPLVITDSGDLLCLDGKVNIDDNALYRQSELEAMRDLSQEDEREIAAKKWELNYISLDGDIGCMVNGAGLAMATMDLIKLKGGNPANFLDVGGGATQERVCEAFKIILSDSKVKGVLVNIFGGIVRCDLIAEGIIGAVAEVGIKVPVVVRLEGNRATEASQILAESDLNIISATSFTDAAMQIVAAIGGSQ